MIRRGVLSAEDLPGPAPALRGGGRASILLLEPRPAIRSGLVRELRGLRLDPIQADLALLLSGGAVLSEGAAGMRPVLIADGEGVSRGLRAIRRAGHHNPILVYQDFRRSERAVELLRAGADGVLTMPLRGVELEARISALHRRAFGHAAGEVRSGPLNVPLDRAPARIDGAPLPMPEAEAALLRLLALNLDRPVSRERLYEHLYEASEAKPYSRILDRYVCNLRRRIAEVWPAGADRIRTLPGYGYALVSDRGEQTGLHPEAEPCDMRKKEGQES